MEKTNQKLLQVSFVIAIILSGGNLFMGSLGGLILSGILAWKLYDGLKFVKRLSGMKI